MSLILTIIGLLVLLVLIYCLLTGTALPQWLETLLLATAVLVLVLCLLQEAGCAPPFLKPTPH